MTIFIIGLILFFGVHSIGVFAHSWRNIEAARLGNEAWKFRFSLVAIIGLVLITIGYQYHTNVENIVIWAPRVWARHLLVYGNLISLILLSAAYIPNNGIKARLKDPMTIGVIIWSSTHLAYVSSLAGVILFTCFLIWALLILVASRKRRAKIISSQANISARMTLLTIILGLALWAIFCRYAYFLHGSDIF